MTKKDIVRDFLLLAAKGKAKQAFHLYVGGNFRHHNAYFKGDAQTLMAAMDENAANNPDLSIEFQRILEDGDLVAVHSHIKQSPDDLGSAVVHICRFRDNKIEELWDLGQAVPADLINENGMF